jgi:hypothetical protein
MLEQPRCRAIEPAAIEQIESNRCTPGVVTQRPRMDRGKYHRGWLGLRGNELRDRRVAALAFVALEDVPLRGHDQSVRAEGNHDNDGPCAAACTAMIE